MHDTIAGCKVFEEALAKYLSLKRVCADAGYRETMKGFVQNVLKTMIEISERLAPGWDVIDKRWMVERIFSWLNHFKSYQKIMKHALNQKKIPL